MIGCLCKEYLLYVSCLFFIWYVWYILLRRMN